MTMLMTLSWHVLVILILERTIGNHPRQQRSSTQHGPGTRSPGAPGTRWGCPHQTCWERQEGSTSASFSRWHAPVTISPIWEIR